MPDRGKVAGAFCLCVLAYILSELIQRQFTRDMNFGYFTYVNMLLGVIVGWMSMGKRAGFGFVPAINNGVTGILSLIIVSLFIQGVNEMLRLALRQRYESPFEAVLSIVTIGFEFAIEISTIEFWATALVGGVVAGLVVEAIWRRWR